MPRAHGLINSTHSWWLLVKVIFTGIEQSLKNKFFKEKKKGIFHWGHKKWSVCSLFDPKLKCFHLVKQSLQLWSV